jgi:gas vesicle protein
MVVVIAEGDFQMCKSSYLTFFAGLGVGVAAVVLFAPESGRKTRRRIRDVACRAGDVFKERTENLDDAADDVLSEIKRASDAARKATDQLIDKARDAAHIVGKKIEEGGKRLQTA